METESKIARGYHSLVLPFRGHEELLTQLGHCLKNNILTALCLFSSVPACSCEGSGGHSLHSTDLSADVLICYQSFVITLHRICTEGQSPTKGRLNHGVLCQRFRTELRSSLFSPFHCLPSCTDKNNPEECINQQTVQSTNICI